jgi:hypothetical protein
MNEELIRTLVREALTRHAAAPPEPDAPPLDSARGALSVAEWALQPVSFVGHSSHFRYTLPPSGGPCVIEPNVQCTHCGYCESHGH